MKRREFIKGGLTVLGAASLVPILPKQKEQRSMGMPFIQKYQITLSDGTKDTVSFSREEIGPGGTVSFYMIEGEGPNEWLVRRYSPTGYIRMVNKTVL